MKEEEEEKSDGRTTSMVGGQVCFCLRVSEMGSNYNIINYQLNECKRVWGGGVGWILHHFSKV